MITILPLCLDVGTGVMEGDMLNLSCCILVNLKRAYFIISIFHSPVEESRGDLI